MRKSSAIFRSISSLALAGWIVVNYLSMAGGMCEEDVLGSAGLRAYIRGNPNYFLDVNGVGYSDERKVSRLASLAHYNLYGACKIPYVKRS